MVEQDTVRLLRECDAGVKMGIDAIKDVLDNVHSEQMRRVLIDCKQEHDKLEVEIREQLDRFGDEGKQPDPMAKGMSRIKTNVKLMMHESDKTVAELITDGCHMGVKSLGQYLNRYKAADERSKDICKKLIKQEERLADDLKEYL